MSWREDDGQAARPWVGPRVRYSLLREVIFLLCIFTALAVILALLFASPARPATRLQEWALNAPADFVTTAATELNGTSETARYGPPYNRGACGDAALSTACAASLQAIGPISPQRWLGVRQRIDAAEDLVVRPLRTQTGSDPALAAALLRWDAAPRARRVAWATAYLAALPRAAYTGGTVTLAERLAMGPVPVMMRAWLRAGRAGALNGALIQSGAFFVSDYTRPLLLLEDGRYFSDIGTGYKLGGDTWGQMNELGSWPGAWWLAPYTLWYQIPPGSTSSAGDMWAAFLVGVIALVTLFLPFIPGLRALPRHLGVHRVIWRHYHEAYPKTPPPGP